jgi:hypothetical protein
MREETADARAVRASFQSSMENLMWKNLTQCPALKCEIASKF